MSAPRSAKAKSTRKNISKKIRFEVFKRDNFTCQYCGAQSPSVILHLDHINPVAGGGGNEIINLLTACADCNSGKGKRTLDDSSALAKQRAQLEELNVRREQLEMMLEWRQGLSDIREQEVDAFNVEFERATNSHINEYGRSLVKKWLKKYSLSELLDGLEAAVGTYYKSGSDDVAEENRLAGLALNMTIRILNARKRYADRPHMKDLFYCRAIIRNRMYCNERVAIDILEQAYDLGAHIIEMQDWAKRATSWTNWRTGMETWIDELQSAESEQ